MNVTTSESGFHTAIDKAPGDFTARLVYADWLADEGRTDEEEFWRWTVAKERTPGPVGILPFTSCCGHDLKCQWQRIANRLKYREDFSIHAVLPHFIINPYDDLGRGSMRPDKMPFEDDHGWLWFSTTPYHAFNHLYLIWSQVLTHEQRQACWNWEPMI